MTNDPMSSSVDYYDMNGAPISFLRWVELIEARQIRVAASRVGRITLSTVWLGLDHSFGDGGPPVIFETMTFPARERDRAKDWQICERYATREAALTGHRRWLTRLKARGVHGLGLTR